MEKTMNAMELEKMAREFNWDKVALINKKKSIQSQKTRLNQKKLAMSEAQYTKELTEMLQKIDAISQCLNYIDPKKKNVTDFEEADIKVLDFDQTVKALASIQSATCRSQYLTKDISENIKWQKYKKIEEMLIEHKKTVKPVDEAYIRKSDLIKTIDAIKSAPDATVETIVEMLENLLK